MDLTTSTASQGLDNFHRRLTGISFLPVSGSAGRPGTTDTPGPHSLRFVRIVFARIKAASAANAALTLYNLSTSMSPRWSCYAVRVYVGTTPFAPDLHTPLHKFISLVEIAFDSTRLQTSNTIAQACHIVSQPPPKKSMVQISTIIISSVDA